MNPSCRHNNRLHLLPWFAAGLFLLQGAALHAQTGAEERLGLRRISSKAFPVPEGSQVLFECDFEDGMKLPSGWSQGRGETVAADDAPQGKAFFRMPAKKNAGLRSPTISPAPGTPCFYSYWIKSGSSPWSVFTFTSDEREPSFTTLHTPISYQDFPLDTGGQWRQEGFYFVMPPQCKTLQMSLNPRDGLPEGQFVCLDHVSLRTASEAEIEAAYQAERANYPVYDTSSRPGDGKNLALSVAKWEGKAGIPGKPFVIWALGSSYTDRQGDGQELIRAIRHRFPNAPPILYRKHGGPGTPWEYVHAWIKQFVAAEQPDLIFTYTSGTLEGLEAMLTEIRKRTTADVIVPSLHFKPPPGIISPDIIENSPGVQWDKVREICAKYGAEFVENRRELADYITTHKLDIEDLLADHNHQNMHGRIRIWDDVSRHLAHSDQAAYKPESRERRITMASEQVSLSGPWITANGSIHTSAAGAKVTVHFTGNQIDVIGRAAPDGGTMKVLIDGVPGGQAPVFQMNYIKPDKKIWRIPHAVDLGEHPAPQSWTLTMTSNTGDYKLAGSVTGVDGTGHLAQPFHSLSGQISLDPKYWRQGLIQKKGQPADYGAAEGDTFTFDVYRSAAGTLSFKAAKDSPLVEAVARGLPNKQHTLELVANGDGEVTMDSFYMFEPPLK